MVTSTCLPHSELCPPQNAFESRPAQWQHWSCAATPVCASERKRGNSRGARRSRGAVYGPLQLYQISCMRKTRLARGSVDGSVLSQSRRCQRRSGRCRRAGGRGGRLRHQEPNRTRNRIAPGTESGVAIHRTWQGPKPCRRPWAMSTLAAAILYYVVMVRAAP